jgi:cyanophycin synthetase
VQIDPITLSILDENNVTLESVLPEGQQLVLKKTANISTGGSAIDFTDQIHPYNTFLAERIARILNLDVCGIDIVAKNITQPLREDNGAVIEVNAAPGLRMHLAPAVGVSRNVAIPIVDYLFPDRANGRIPVVAITGTNGKTTTTRLIAHFAKAAGHHVGYTTTDGVYINDYMIVKGDCTGPKSAETVLTDPTVDFAVLESARGGILRAGLGFDQCDVSVITNISDDHLGIDGINTLDDLTRLKSVVAHATSKDGYSVLNADDDRVLSMRDDLKCKVALFSMSPLNPRVMAHGKVGGLAAVVDKGTIVVYHGRTRIPILPVNEIPLTFRGKAECMIQNVLAAVLVGMIKNFNVDKLREALMSFKPSAEQTPGRMNLFQFNKFTVMVDYAHNMGGMREMKKFIRSVNAPVKIGIITGVGDRRDEDIRNLANISATMFDEIIIRLDKDLRGRSAESIVNLLKEGISESKPYLQPIIIPDEHEAINYAMQAGIDGCFITVFTEDVEATCRYVHEANEKQHITTPEDNAKVFLRV